MLHFILGTLLVNGAVSINLLYSVSIVFVCSASLRQKLYMFFTHLSNKYDSDSKKVGKPYVEITKAQIRMLILCRLLHCAQQKCFSDSFGDNVHLCQKRMWWCWKIR